MFNAVKMYEETAARIWSGYLVKWNAYLSKKVDKLEEVELPKSDTPEHHCPVCKRHTTEETHIGFCDECCTEMFDGWGKYYTRKDVGGTNDLNSDYCEETEICSWCSAPIKTLYQSVGGPEFDKFCSVSCREEHDAKINKEPESESNDCDKPAENSEDVAHKKITGIKIPSSESPKILSELMFQTSFPAKKIPVSASHTETKAINTLIAAMEDPSSISDGMYTFAKYQRIITLLEEGETHHEVEASRLRKNIEGYRSVIKRLRVRIEVSENGAKCSTCGGEALCGQNYCQDCIDSIAGPVINILKDIACGYKMVSEKGNDR